MLMNTIQQYFPINEFDPNMKIEKKQTIHIILQVKIFLINCIYKHYHVHLTNRLLLEPLMANQEDHCCTYVNERFECWGKKI